MNLGSSILQSDQNELNFVKWSELQNEVNSKMNLAWAFYSDPHLEEKNEVNSETKMTPTVECSSVHFFALIVIARRK